MSRTISAPRRLSRIAVAGILTLAMALLATASVAPQANAAFVTGVCEGSDVTGRGASFARDAHTVFNFNFKNNYCIGTPGFGSINVTYEALGSGAGRLAVKVRNDAPRFGMTDEPPTPSEVAQMNAGTGNEPAGTDANTADNGQIHVVPAAVGAVAPLVNFPNDCDVSLLPAEAKTAEQDKDNDMVPDDVVRVRFTKTQFEKIWAKAADADEWDEVFPTLADVDCADEPIVRIVRFDDSGTSFAFKDYLNTIDGAEGWLTTYVAGANKTREWPGASFGDRDDCGDNDGVVEASDPDGPGSPGLAGDTDNLTTGCSNGNGALVSKLISTDGSVGYSDVSTARNASPSLAISPEVNDNDTYWTQIPNGSETFTEPTADSFGFRTDGLKGANCQATSFENVPDDTFGDWSQVSGVDSPVGFGICTLTYGLVFDDNADVWGNTPAEETKAATVKDYWDSIVTNGAQGQLFGNDYAPLPAAILAISREGVEGIDWNKGEGGGGGEEEVVKPPEEKDTGGGDPPAKPSNAFTLLRKSISSKTGAATISVRLPGAGTLEMVGTAKKGKKTIKVGRTVLNANQAGTFGLMLKPSAAAKAVLRKKGKLVVKLALSFTPNGGDEKDSTSSLTLKLTKPKK